MDSTYSARSSRWLSLSSLWLTATLAAAFLCWILLVAHANASTAAILFLVTVVLFSTLAGQTVSVYLAIVSGLLFDYYFTEPLHTLAIARPQDVISIFAYVLSCIVVSRLAEGVRRQTIQAEQRREDVERLYSLSQEMMLHDDAGGLVLDIPRLVEGNFLLDTVLLYVRDEDRIYSSVSGVADIMLAPLRSITWAGESNPGVVEGYSAVSLVFGMQNVGTLAWKPAHLSLEVATSVAAQVAIAITRAHAIESSAHLEAARAADRLRAAMIDSLTHELRTPLTAIRVAATTLLDGQGLDDESRTELATIVDEESARLDALIGEAMEIAEIESDGIRVHPEPVNLTAFLEQAIEQSHDQLRRHQISIFYDVAPALDVSGQFRTSDEKPRQDAGDVVHREILARFDPHLMSRVLRHLLENAARYTPAGSRIVLRGRLNVDRIEFSVEDNGPGIHAHDLPMIFEKFYRGKNIAVAPKGSGMGLSITRALLIAQGGGITVESALDKGTIFDLWIPSGENAQQTAKTDAI